MENKKTITLEVFDAANIMSYAQDIKYNCIISALADFVAIYKENHLGMGNKEIDESDFINTLCLIIEYCESVEALRQEVEYALKDKDLTPFYKK